MESMGILSAIRSVEPTRLLQTILATEVEVYRNKDRYTVIQKGFQGGLLFSASIVGVFACASEIMSLGSDIFCKSAQKSIRGVQYIGKPAFLDRLYKNVSHRPSLAFRIERILSQAIGILVSVLGTFFMLVIRNEWVTSQHQSLGNLPPAVPGRPTQKTTTLVPSESQTSISPTAVPPHAASGAPKAAPLVVAKTAAQSGTALLSKDSPIPPPPSGKNVFIPITKSDQPSQALKKIEALKKSKQPQSETQVTESSTKSSRPSSAAKTSKSPQAAVTFAQELESKTKEREENAPSAPVVVPTKQQRQVMNTMGRAMNRLSMAQRPQSERIQCTNIAEGFLVKANEIKLKEIETELGIEFEEKDKTKTLSDLIFNNNGGFPEEGTIFEFKGFKIQIVKIAPGNVGIQKVRVKFPNS
jgi:hypothetical protein